MALSLEELARALGAELAGDAAVRITGVATLEDAGPEHLSFLANRKYRGQLDTTRAGAVIVAAADRVEHRNCLVSPNPYLAFARAVALLHPDRHPDRGVEPGARVAPDAQLGEAVTVLAGAYIEEGVRVGAGTVIYPGVYLGRGVQVGEQCVLYPNAVVREDCVLGNRVVLQPGAVIGSDGFGYARDGARQVRFPQVGIVVLEDDVEVGACTTVDRAALGETRIGRGTKIDNQVQIAHNVRVGQDCTLVSQVGISGSSTLGDRVILAGQVGVVGHLTLGDGVIVGAQSGVPGDLPAGTMVSGSPAMPHQDWLKVQGVLRRLPELRSKLREMEKRLTELEGSNQASGAEADSGERP
ncbi:MAG: UDP-3-O-(3-hydroxymyristoyl)glucosamine N-acyltransferase [Deferrisomatales bacterium]|nr:UDP-3-O-(3-hydroxymyristoyl)glucosamine N-acyltransferase [Deferrisomatales bacterium]